MLLFFIFSVFASEQSYRQYCFADSLAAQKALIKLDFIKGNSEKHERSENCLNLIYPSTKEDIYQRYISDNLPHAQKSYLPAPEKKRCQLKILKSTTYSSKARNAALGNISQLNVNRQNSQEHEEIHLVMSSGKDASMTLENQAFQVNCTVLGLNYKVKIEVKPVVNQAPSIQIFKTKEGNFIIAEQPPKDSEHFYLSAEFNLKANEKVSLGSLVKRLNEQTKGISLNGGFTFVKLSEDKFSKYTLMTL